MIRIDKVVQIKSNMYELFFDNKSKLKVYDEVIIKFNLLVGTCINEDFIEDIKKYNDLMIIFFKFRNSLIKKLESKNKVCEKLKKEIESAEDIAEIIIKLEKLNLINDENYLKAYINSQINLTLNGPGKIKNSLLSEKIDENKIDDELCKYDINFWNNRVDKIIVKRKKANHKDSFGVFKLKTKNYIYSLGYNFDVDIENDVDNELQNLKKEYDKLLRKYTRKNLDKKNIKYDLIKKGYKSVDINDVINEGM